MSGKMSKYRHAAVVFALLTGVAGCAYGVYQDSRVVNPGRLAEIRFIAVAPFRYPHRWTGYFRDIYRKAGLIPPAVEKVDQVEATFLPVGVLIDRGYEVRNWPFKAGKVKWAGGAPGPGMKKALLKILPSGVEAALLIRGQSECPEIYHCIAVVNMWLVDARTGSLLWKSKAEGTTLIGQGNEMRAAVEEALGALPAPRPLINVAP
jgi:hypothetical protein